MNASTTQGLPRQNWHFLLVLLPFIIGIYLADFRILTYQTLLFAKISSAIGLGLVVRKSTKQLGVLLLFFNLGFWHLFFAQSLYRAQRNLFFDSEVKGLLHVQSIENKGAYQKIIGVFELKQNRLKRAVNMLIYCKGKIQIDQRKVYWLNCKPDLIQNEAYPGAFDQERYYELQQMSHRVFIEADALHVSKRSVLHRSDIKAGLVAIKTRISELFSVALSQQSSAIARALILGERDGIDQELRAYFLATGSMHILAVSGMHIGLLIVALLKVLELLSRWISRKQALFIIIVIVWSYAFLTGLSASVLRSVFMFSVLILSQLLGKQMSNLNALFFSAFCLLLYDPLYLFDLGFQLSYLAMLGIYLYYERIKVVLAFKWRWVQQLWDGTALGLAATLTTLPLSLYHFHLYPNYAQIANLCLMSLSSFILILGMFFPLLQALPYLDKLSAYILETCIQWMLGIMRFFSEAPGAIAQGFELPFLWVLSFWILTFLWFYTWPKHHNNALKSWCLLCLFIMVFQRQQLLYSREIFFYRSDSLIIIREGKVAKAFGTKSEKKYTFLLRTFENLKNCKIDYLQVNKGTTCLRFRYVDLRIYNQQFLKLYVNAKKQTQKIKVF
jgi:ComEC/Rec2-related protein